MLVNEESYAFRIRKNQILLNKLVSSKDQVRNLVGILKVLKNLVFFIYRYKKFSNNFTSIWKQVGLEVIMLNSVWYMMCEDDINLE